MATFFGLATCPSRGPAMLGASIGCATDTTWRLDREEAPKALDGLEPTLRETRDGVADGTWCGALGAWVASGRGAVAAQRRPPATVAVT